MNEKIIGIIGGMGPEATRDLYDNIIHLTRAAKDQDHLHTIIDSNPRIPDRTAFIIGKGEDPLPAMLAGGRRLQAAGADFAVIPCISAHFFLEKLRAQLEIPILSAFEEVAREIRVYPNITRIGLLATDGTVRSGGFADTLAAHGIQTLVPDTVHQQNVMEAIYTIKGDSSGEKRYYCRDLFQAAAEHLIQNSAQGIIAGCTEIPLALHSSDITVPLFNPLTILAAAAVENAGGSKADTP